MYYCDDEWHDGQRTDAEFLLLPENDEDKGIKISFATCGEHITRALAIMFGQNKFVRVRKVSN